MIHRAFRYKISFGKKSKKGQKRPMSANILPVGKLPAGLLEKLLRQYGSQDGRVIVGPAIGEDAAVINFGDTCLVAKTDPITFVSKNCGWYAVNINANDIAAMGAVPRWFLATVLLPEGASTAGYAREIFADISRACKELDISLCGGHTEITSGLDQTIIVGQMLGEVSKNKLVLSSGAKPGDDIIMTKGIAIEGVSIIAREMENRLKRRKYKPGTIRRLCSFIRNPGISVLKEAALAASLSGIHAMHDPTEGGLSTGLYEISKASNVGLEIDEGEILFLPECLKLCKEFGLNPLGLIASGCLIIITSPETTEPLKKLLTNSRIACSVIGKVVRTPGVRLVRKSKRSKFPRFKRDEITKCIM